MDQEAGKRVYFQDLGRIPYQEAWDFQEALMQYNRDRKEALAHSISPGLPGASASADTRHFLLFCEHPPVYTLGKSGKAEHLLAGPEWLASHEVGLYRTNRGGDITFHGPGQIVGYPILDLERIYTDIGKFLRALEQVIIDTLEAFGIRAGRSPGQTGVWIDPGDPLKARKICAMGIRCSRWITMHGFALNVNTSLDYFDQIIPCGIPDRKVSSMRRELGHELEIEGVKDQIKKDFARQFGLTISAFCDAGYGDGVLPVPLAGHPE